MQKAFLRRLKTKAERFVPKTGTYPKGFEVGALHCGIKKKADIYDLAMLRNMFESPTSAAGVFTKNKFKAAPVQVSYKILEDSKGEGINSIIINSGNANAVTGQKGKEDAEKMVKTTDEQFGDNSPSTLVMSTGVIGQNLPIQKITTGIKELASKGLGSSHGHWVAFAEGICTTDTFPKLISATFSANGQNYSLAGIAKGAGMICPNMATLLGCVATDAPIEPSSLKKILTYATDRSFNSITVDGDMSTNDTILGIANGAAGGPIIDEKDEAAFLSARNAITEVSQTLAKLVVRDGEGATKFIEIKVRDAKSFEDAKSIALTIANSSLFKTAMYGKDANWGRILCAIGYSDVTSENSIIPSKTCVSFVPSDGSEILKCLVNGEPELVDEERASEILACEDLLVDIDLGTKGGFEASIWTCDLSHEYVTINGDYRS